MVSELAYLCTHPPVSLLYFSHLIFFYVTFKYLYKLSLFYVLYLFSPTCICATVQFT